MPGITLVEGLVLRNTDTKHDYKGCGRVDRIAETALQCSIFFLSKAPKVISGSPSEVKSYLHNFQSDLLY